VERNGHDATEFLSRARACQQAEGFWGAGIRFSSRPFARLTREAAVTGFPRLLLVNSVVSAMKRYPDGTLIVELPSCIFWAEQSETVTTVAVKFGF
jgi:hypothetical protein